MLVLITYVYIAILSDQDRIYRYKLNNTPLPVHKLVTVSSLSKHNKNTDAQRIMIGRSQTRIRSLSSSRLSTLLWMAPPLRPISSSAHGMASADDSRRVVVMIELPLKVAFPLNTPTAPNSSFKAPPFFSWWMRRHKSTVKTIKVQQNESVRDGPERISLHSK